MKPAGAAMTAEDIWRAKSDDELMVAAERLSEYTEAGQRVITAELERRRLHANSALGDEGTYSGETEASSASDSAPLPRSRNFAARLWHGEISLPMTYWIWGVLGSRISLATVLIVGTMVGSPILALIGLACYLAYMVIVFVAIWRSSARYKGPRIWSDLARVSLALGALRVVAELFVPR